MGVRRAVEMALDASSGKKGPIYTFGPIIHNPQVLQILEQRGISILDRIPDSGSGTVLIRAHGVPPEDKLKLRTAGYKVIDATCPRVIKVQSIIQNHTRRDFASIIIGDRDHPEVIGLCGYAGGNSSVAGTIEALAALPPFEKAIIVAQTTQNMILYEKVKDWAHRNFPQYKIFDTICHSTSRRQAEVKRLAESVDAMIVVGGFNSGNTKRLAEIAQQSCHRAYHIETAADLVKQELLTTRNIGITAGASTPNWIINKVYRSLESLPFNKKQRWRLFFYNIRRSLLLTNIYVSMGAGFLCYACTKLLGISEPLPYIIISILYVQSMHIFNHLTGSKADRYNDPDRASFYRNNKILLSILAFVAGAAGLITAFTIGPTAFFILLVMSGLGLSYHIRLVPKQFKFFKYRRIRDLPSSKTLLIATAWGIVTSLFPTLSDQGELTPVAIIIFLWSTGIVFVRTAFFDILDMQGDRIVGRNTIPIIIGEKRTRAILKIILAGLFILLLFSSLLHLIGGLGYILIFCPVFIFIVIFTYEKGDMLPGTTLEFLIESSFILAGLLVFAGSLFIA